MIHSTRGIVLQRINYSETSLIVRIYTEELGLRSYILKGVRKSGSRIPQGLLQNLSMLNLVVSHAANRNLNYIKEAAFAYTPERLLSDVKKSSLLMFMNEILVKSIREEESNRSLFEFLFDSLVTLDKLEKGISLFHIIFMIRLSRHLGFFPGMNFSAQRDLFDLSEGRFVKQFRDDRHQMPSDISRTFSELLSIDYGGIDKTKIAPAHRDSILEYLLQYYSEHLPGFGHIKSLKILKTIFS